MTQVTLELEVLPEKHGLWFRRAVVDGLMGYTGDKAKQPPKTHAATYRKGFALGETLKMRIDEHEKKAPRRRPRSSRRV